jgi:phosphoribosylformylglycinamidine synthase
MLWEIELESRGRDSERERIAQEYGLLTHREGSAPVERATRGFLLDGQLRRDQAECLLDELLVDPVAEKGSLKQLEDRPSGNHPALTVLLKPGVMDPVVLSVVGAARDLGIPLKSVRTFRRYYLDHTGPSDQPDEALRKVLANDAIEQIVHGGLGSEHLAIGKQYRFERVTVALRGLDDAGLERLSREGQLSLSLPEMRTIQEHFRSLGREPTDVELETIAQTWSEHCSHKTLKGRIECPGKRYDNLLKETIFAATQEIRRRLGADDWCVSVFEDNAGVVRFDDHYHVCFKVETHNHPSAIEPYGGANTGLGGVIRDPLGTGLGAKPICNTDVFCFAPPDTPPEALPAGVLHPRRVMLGVVAGVRDYGNRMGIATVNGAVCFDEAYLGNPLVFCGTVGLLPVERVHKEARPGDLIVAVGGRTGRDGIHGATFSSIELTSESEKVSGGAVQIGNAITEKKMLDVLLEARDRGFYHAITDCGAGGFSSAVGEMGEKIGAVVDLERVPLKYQGLSYTEIWISEAQERMVLAVRQESWPALHVLCEGEDVEATVIGKFEPTGKLRLRYQGEEVAELEMDFLHNGRPPVVRKAVWNETPIESPAAAPPTLDFNDALRKILGSFNVCSKETIIRQYDHEVQGLTTLKPLVGISDDGPGDAAVVTPVLGSFAGLAIGCGLNPRWGRIDPYRMAAAVIDEAVRNVVAVGADPGRIAILDNFCWGNTDRPEVLGSLVCAAEACRDVALAYGTPFISGKDSLNNEFHTGDRHIVIPPTLLISAMGRISDVRRCVTMDLKAAGNELFLIGVTRDEMAGSHFHLVTGIEGGSVPTPDLDLAPLIFRALHGAITEGLVRSCHDLSEGGLAVAAAEMAFAGGIGADLTLMGAGVPDHVLLFSESCTRFLIEVSPAHVQELVRLFDGLPLTRIGTTNSARRLRIAGAAGEWLIWAQLAELKEAWQSPLRW